MMKSVQVFLSCYKRPEYTQYTLDNLEKNTVYENVQFYLVDDGSGDYTKFLFQKFGESRMNTTIKVCDKNKGLRYRLQQFFEESSSFYLCKIDNDCLFSKGWLVKLVKIFENCDLDILAPNEEEKNPAEKLGRYDKQTNCYLLKERVRAVGGLWIMKKDLLKDVK